MASANIGTSGSGRHRSLDAELNLVPFIDLLSMCICFLLITAVWVNIGAVQVKQSHGTDAAAPASDQLELEARFATSSSMELTFKRQGKTIRKEGIKADSPAALKSAIDAGMAGWVGNTAVSAAMIYPKTGVSYGDLVSVMDVLRKHRIANLGVVPPSGEI